jgi:tetratricopeptide (TPR) repeat protein
MKQLFTTVILAIGFSTLSNAQLAPQPSPSGKLEQRVGLTDVTIQYSRPSKKNRVVFGDVVPFGEVWRTGANENTKFTNSDVLIFGKDSLKPGTYALYTKPTKESWDLIFYTDTENWGTPEKWDDSKVALKVSSKPMMLKDAVETFTISIDGLESVNGATLTLKWDQTGVAFPFSVPTDSKVMANINKVMAGPSANDYAGAASYYLENKKDLKKALEWATKATDMEPEAFWIFRTKSLIQAELGDKKGAIESAKKGLALAEKASYAPYVKMFNESLKEWGK